MTPVPITIPPAPTGQPDLNNPNTALPVTDIEFYLWKQAHAKATKRKDEYDEHMAKAYIVIVQQCSPTLRNELETDKTFPAVCSSQDPIALLKLIQGFCCSYDSKVQSVMATVASHKRLFTHYQCNGLDNHTYHREFMSFVKTIETYGGVGAEGVIPTFLDEKNQGACH
jgi:hypothetical protein